MKDKINFKMWIALVFITRNSIFLSQVYRFQACCICMPLKNELESEIPYLMMDL